MPEERTLRCAIVGYGSSFNMGRTHAQYINAIPGLQAVAVCDLDPLRLEQARIELGDTIQTFRDVGDMLARADVDLVTVVTPHNTHARLAIQCLEAGKHVVTEKPMCITVAEATEMIDTARRCERMLSVFHNRRWDGDHLAMRAIVDEGLLGELFHIEVNGGGWYRPGSDWRSDKAISGGAFYDWGAHLLYWVLGFLPGRIRNVTGFYHKRVWDHVTNEDHTQAVIRWENGAYADVQISTIARAPKPRWRILGTKGALLDEGQGQFTVYSGIGEHTARFEVKYRPTDWQGYYQNIADHLLRGQPLEITPQSARRVIALIETAEKSSRSGQAEPVPCE
ncbi:MAG: Gfo/Idh/MocA family oxidoreductase [Armatimonadetes bacterium]|nr:Gfo/Idh/MocA family oxidoreductase [Armatimonadota bacterium]